MIESEGKDSKAVSGTIYTNGSAVTEEIRAAMKSADWKVRAGTVMEITNMGQEALLILVDAALHDEDERVRAIASDSLGRRCDMAAIPTLVDALASDDARLGVDAAGAIYNIFWNCRNRAAVRDFEAAFEGAVKGKTLPEEGQRFFGRMRRRIAERYSQSITGLREAVVSGVILTDRPKPPKGGAGNPNTRLHHA